MADEETYTLEDLAMIVESEGIDYAIEDYVNSDRIEDEAVKAVWKHAESALMELRKLLATDESYDDPDGPGGKP